MEILLPAVQLLGWPVALLLAVVGWFIQQSGVTSRIKLMEAQQEGVGYQTLAKTQETVNQMLLAVNAQNVQMQGRLDALNTRLESERDLRVNEIGERQRLQHQLDEARRQLDEARKRESDMMTVIESLQSRVKELEQKLKHMEDEINRYKNEAEAEREKREETERKLAKRDQEIQQLKQELALKAQKDKDDAN